MKRVKLLLHIILTRQSSTIKTFFLIALFSCSLYVGYKLTMPENTFFGEFMDPFIAIFTAFLAIIIWGRDEYSRWIDHLPKKLTVHYKFNNEYVYTCHEAELTSQADIRQWGQQIGKQMNSNANLDFFPYFDIVSQYKIQDVKTKEFYNHFIITFYLMTDIKQKNYKVWWENDAKTALNKSIIYKTRPKTPFEKSIVEADYFEKTSYTSA